MKKRILCTVLAVVMLFGAFYTGSVPVRAEANFTVSDQGEAMIKAFEGFNEIPKWDNKQNSVGWGCSITREEWEKTEKNPDGTITEAAAQKLLDAAMEKHGAEVNAFANKYGLELTQAQFDALTSLSFNIGGSWMKQTGYHIFKAVTSGDMGAYLAYAFTLYSTSGGITTQGHMKRRLLELQMYLYGIYDTEKIWPEELRYVLLDANGGASEYNPHGFNVNYPVQAEDMWTYLTAPTGTGADGETFTYEFAGWYDAPVGGREITVLDEALANGTILYAHWKNPTTGNIDDLQPGTAVDVKVKATANVTLREGPATYYTAVRTAYKDELLHITRIAQDKLGNQWGLSAEGWVPLTSTNYGTTAESPEPLEPGIYATVTATNVLIRTGPGTNYDKTGDKMVTGQTYKLQATQKDGEGNNWGQLEDGNWFCVQYGDKNYATIQVITEQTPEPEPETPAPDISGALTVTKVEVKELPAKTEYALAGSDRILDPTGGRVRITLSDGTRKYIDMTRAMISGFDNTKKGTNTITVTVGGMSDTFEIQIVPVNITSVTMEKLPGKLQYLKNEEQLDLTGVTIKVQYSPMGEDIIPVTADMVSGFDNTVPGIQTIVVTYKNYTTSFQVEVVSNDPQGIVMNVLPQKLQYLQGLESLDLTGASIKLHYSITGDEIIPLAADMVTGFDNRKAGMQRLTVSYMGFTTTFDVEVILPTVTFLNYDGSVLSSAQYEIGAAVTPPENPTRPQDEQGDYEFVGWDREVTACNGNATYTAQYKLSYPTGDVDRNRAVDEDDVIYLLRHLVFPENYPCYVNADFNKDGKVDEDDVIYLLRHLVFPEEYPLS